MAFRIYFLLAVHVSIIICDIYSPVFIWNKIKNHKLNEAENDNTGTIYNVLKTDIKKYDRAVIFYFKKKIDSESSEGFGLEIFKKIEDIFENSYSTKFIINDKLSNKDLLGSIKTEFKFSTFYGITNLSDVKVNNNESLIIDVDDESNIPIEILVKKIGIQMKNLISTSSCSPLFVLLLDFDIHHTVDFGKKRYLRQTNQNSGDGDLYDVKTTKFGALFINGQCGFLLLNLVELRNQDRLYNLTDYGKSFGSQSCSINGNTILYSVKFTDSLNLLNSFTFKFTITSRSKTFRCTQILVISSVNEVETTIFNYIPRTIVSGVKSSYYCNKIKFRTTNWALLLTNFQIQPYNIKNNMFSDDVTDCHNIVEISHLMGLFALIILGTIVFFGLSMVFSVKSPSHFESQKHYMLFGSSG